VTPDLMRAGAAARRAAEERQIAATAGRSGGRETSYSRVVRPGEVDVAHGAILYLDDITVSFDGFKALNELSLAIDVGELRCIIGPNGAGKTTMMDVVTGKTRPDSGHAHFGSNVDLLRLREPEIVRAGICRKFQKPTVYEQLSVFENLEFKLPPGGIVGVIGPNGAGKTTLFRMLTGQDKPDSGELRIGDTVHMGYVDQSRDDLEPNKTVWQEISGGTDILEFGKTKMSSRAYVGAFNFKGGDQQKKVGQLSGGERNRVHLAKLLKGGANLLLLDEPTNDLDVETLRALELALEEFAGCAMIISHDRWFLDRMATHMLAFEGDSHVEWFEGNFQDYEADKKRRLDIDADQPHRIKYKRFARA